MILIDFELNRLNMKYEMLNVKYVILIDFELNRLNMKYGMLNVKYDID